MNTRAKGNRTVRKIIDIMTENGYICEKVEKTGRFIKDKDLYGYWDILCLKKGEVVFIQAKTNRKPKMVDYQAFADKYKSEHIKFEIWIWFDRKGFEVYKL